MSAHLSAETLERYCRRLLSPSELLDADDHLAACAACRRSTSEVYSAGKILAALRFDLQRAASFDFAHLSDEQMAAFIDHNLDAAERGIVKSHLTVCASCADEIDDLRAFRETLTHAPATVATATPTLWEKIQGFGFRPGAWSPMRLAATVAGVLLLAAVTVTLLYVWQATRVSRTETATSPAASSEVRPEQVAVENSSVPTPEPAASPFPSPAIVIALNDGGQRVTLDAQGNFAGLGALSPATQRTFRTALETGRVDVPPALATLSGQAETLMGGAAEGVAFPLISPVGTVVRTDRPTLRWSPLAGARSYTVTLLDANLKTLATSPPLTATGWSLPRSLARGEVYSWQVTAIKDGQEIVSPAAPAPEARFKILDQASAERLRRIEATNPNSHLARGVSYAQAGLLDDAEREFRALLAANPQSPIARKLLRNVEALRRPK